MLTNSLRIPGEKIPLFPGKNYVQFWLASDAHNLSKDSCYFLISFRCSQIQKGFLRNSVEFWLTLDSHKFSKDSCGKFVQISVRIHAEKFPLFPGRIYFQFWLASDAHKFSKDSCGKFSLFPGRIYVQFWLVSDAHKFSKDSCVKISTFSRKDLGSISISFRCSQFQ